MRLVASACLVPEEGFPRRRLGSSASVVWQELGVLAVPAVAHIVGSRAFVEVAALVKGALVAERAALVQSATSARLAPLGVVL